MRIEELARAAATAAVSPAPLACARSCARARRPRLGLA